MGRRRSGNGGGGKGKAAAAAAAADKAGPVGVGTATPDAFSGEFLTRLKVLANFEKQLVAPSAMSQACLAQRKKETMSL